MNERIPRREAPDFRDSEDGVISSILEDGFLNVALDDANQYGPHAMIIFLGLASVLTGSILGLAMVDPILSVGTVILIVGSILTNFLIAKFKLPGR